jgi:hypothetical protein
MTLQSFYQNLQHLSQKIILFSKSSKQFTQYNLSSTSVKYLPSANSDKVYSFEQIKQYSTILYILNANFILVTHLKIYTLDEFYLFYLKVEVL